MTKTRTAYTKNGTEVILGKCYPTDGGFLAWELNGKGYAVSCFIPVGEG